MWGVMCVCHHVCHMQARSCLSTGWALNRCFAWISGTATVLAPEGADSTIAKIFVILCINEPQMIPNAVSVFGLCTQPVNKQLTKMNV